jgi:hypothetical protein
LYVHGDPIGVPVEALAFVAGRDMGETVGCLEGELLEDLHGVVSSVWFG